MPFTHHSHSGQFCNHGANKLEEVLQAAIAKKMEVLVMTEHMPRRREDLYPEEVTKGETPSTLEALFAEYYEEAQRLRKAYAKEIRMLVGMEIDWIRPSSLQDIQGILSTHKLDLFVGSVHHVHEIPTDYSRELYLEARTKSGGTDEHLFQDYFDLQLNMLKALRPPIVGHFDVIRLLSDNPNESMAKWPGVWEKVLRNLDFVVEYGGVLEMNSAALRKGLDEPYPKGDICKQFIEKGGQFTISDDCHDITQVATHYQEMFRFIDKIGMDTITVFEIHPPTATAGDSRFPGLVASRLQLADLKRQPFFI